MVENHFLFEYFYDEIGLISGADAYENVELSFQITYDKEFG